ncbi:MAG: tRNA (adenosine(37)-N6)-threonylcarbamoyltransferase complex ATPase subunit type 1 TsaE [Ignavibacteria bacterium GWA2_54_16]|nr:MAG: tRNA (adenosine(37)-N6)-threonylcarbamoyltransferase complex ATPase subunit type 1 TsaE [Ignavibacteria bacterium GWA2_54_16]
MRTEHTTSSEEATRALARSFALQLNRGDVVALQGELGTGKTRFVKGICEAFEASRHVSSPSFVILNRYEGRDRSHRPLYLYHLDLYRVKSVEEIYDLGFEEFAYGDNVTLIEWSEQLGGLLPSRRFEVQLSYGDAEDQRRISIELVESPAPPVEG